MSMFTVLWRQKIVWASLAAVVVIIAVLGTAMMGSVLGAKPQKLPVALVVQDEEVAVHGGGQVAAGDMIREKLLNSAELPLPFEWELVESEQAARDGMDEGRYYGALILPADLSRGLMSLLGAAEPKPAAVTIIANEGLNVQGAAAVKQGLGQVMEALRQHLPKQMLGMAAKTAGAAQAEAGSGSGANGNAQNMQLSYAAAEALLTPFHLNVESVHPVGKNQASGNAPGMLTQVMWIGSLVIAVMLSMGQARARASAGSLKVNNKSGGMFAFGTVVSQALTGIVLTGAAAAFLLWVASGWYGMELQHAADIWVFLWFGGVVFFMLQSALFNWIGMPAIPILVLLMFFSMPLLNMAPEFLSQTTQDWLYSWIPLRFVASGMREMMYFGGWSAVGDSKAVMWGVATVCLVLLLASSVRRNVRLPGAQTRKDAVSVSAE
ncbi:YhgE/Pip domain-containing protein [Paenibacillus sp. GCM10027626]|uniref:YhgE/Pip domain-containing protein n=1 Tax=Paenibacillus sp. GCM10027626 TaxID=3273411 RepID=UPI003631FD1F